MENVRKSKEVDARTERKLLVSDEQVKGLKGKIADLEKYKILCEQRVLELFPGHQLPVQEGHLGTNAPYLIEIQMYKQRISRLEQQLFEKNFPSGGLKDERKIEEIVKEKLILEESLRAEILNSEEQRAYIEVLKQYLEENSKFLPQGNKGKYLNFEIKRENANIKTLNKDLNSQIEKLKNEVNEKTQELEAALKETSSLNDRVKFMAEEATKNEEEIARLEYEKLDLAEYIDQLTQKETDLETEINEMTQIFEEMKVNYSETMKKFHEESVKNKNLNSQIDELQKDLESSLRLGRESQIFCEDLKEKLRKTKGSFKRVLEDKRKLENTIENLLLNNITLSETLKETQDEVEDLKNNLELKEKALEDLEQIGINIEKELIEKDRKINSLNLAISALEKESLSKTQEKNEALKEQENEKLASSKNKTTELTKRTPFPEDPSQLKKSSSKELQFSASQDEIRVLEKSIFDLQEDNKRLKVDYKETQRAFTEALKDREAKSEQVGLLLQELNYFRQIIPDNKPRSIIKDEKIADRNSSKFDSEITSQLRSLQEKELNLSHHINFLQNRLKEEENLSSFLQENLRELKFKYESQEMSYSGCRNQLISCVQAILQHLSLSKQYNYSVLSPSFQDLLRNIEAVPSPEICDILKFSASAAENLKFLLDINSALQEEINNKGLDVSLSFSRIEGLNSEVEAYKGNVIVLNSQLETLSKENLSLRAQFQALSQENFDLKTSLNKSLSSLDQLESTVKGLELENRALKTEKNQLGKPLGSCRTGLKENFRADELEVLERDRLNIQYQLLKFQGDSKRNEMMFRELGNKLKICENEILSYHTSMTPVRERRETPIKPLSFMYPESINRIKKDTSHSYRERANFY